MPLVHRPEVIAAGRAFQAASHRFQRGPGFPYVSSACIVTGRARLQLHARDEVLLHAPSLVQIAPRTPYLLGAADSQGWEEIWVISTPSPEQEAAVSCWPMPAPGLRLLELAGDPVRSEILTAAAGIPEAEDPARPELPALRENAWERVLLLARGARARQPSSLPNALVAAAQAHLATRLGQRHSLGALARAFAISPSHLSQLFRLQLGEPPMRHLRRMRIARARSLLLGTNRPVEAIARDVGFDDPGHFSGVFHQLVGCPPRAFRQRGDGLRRT